MSTHTRLLQRWIAILTIALGVLGSLMVYLLWRDGQNVLQPLPGNTHASSIIIKRNGFEDISLTKQESSWVIESPCQIRANGQRLEPLLGALTPEALHYDADEVDLAAAGLESPLAIVSIDGTEHRIGAVDLNGDRRYVQRGNQVAFAPEWVLSLINGGVTALADLAVFPGSLLQLELSDAQGQITVLTSTDELQPWQSLSAQQIVSWPLQDMAVPAPALQVNASVSNGDSVLYTVYHTDRFTALTLDEEHCAYILALDTLPNQ